MKKVFNKNKFIWIYRNSNEKYFDFNEIYEPNEL